MKSLFIVLCLFSLNAHSKDVFRIEIGQDYHQYSNADLQRRVWELERAVMQIQQRVFDLEVSKSAPVVIAKPQETWVCTIHAFSDTYTGTGTTKALATVKAVEACKASNNGMFCKDVKCEQ